jgi:hypothetical protein
MLGDVRFGSKADFDTANSDVRFTPNSGHLATGLRCPLSANSCHMRRSKFHRYSITSSARLK